MGMVRERIGPAWRYFLLNWALLAVMGAALVLGLAFTGFSIGLPGLALSLGFVSVYAAFAHANARAPARRDPQVMFVLGATAQIVLITIIMTPLTYVAASTNLPMQDDNLLAIDRALGLDWEAYATTVNAHPVLASWLSYGYSMIRWPIFAIPAVLAAAARYHRLQEFTMAFALALIVTTILSGLVPAVGAYEQVGIHMPALADIAARPFLDETRSLFDQVRDGTLRELNILGLAGLVTFPSFHAASAVLYAWALWPVRWIRPFVILANGAMLASTPIDGGHYFIDLAAGMAVAAGAILAARAISRRLARHRGMIRTPSRMNAPAAIACQPNA
jgi:hypothetical protein